MISVCIATYNGAPFLEKQLISILNQLSVNDELIISDDGSIDGTLDVINSINDNRIKIIHNEKKQVKSRSSNHIYVSANFENALKRARGDYIFLSDQDDIWCNGKVDKMIQLLSEKENILVISNFSTIDANDNIIEPLFLKKKPFYKIFLLNLLKTPFWGCCMAFKKELLMYALPFPKNLILHDNWIGLLALHYGVVKYINDPLILYRRHQNNVSKNKSENPIWYKIFYRIKLYFQYQKRIYHNNS